MRGNFWRKRFGGCRFTLPRQAVIEVLSQTKEHLTADDIYMKVHQKYPSCGLATIYRTLELLTNMGMVKKFDFGQRRWSYQFNDPDKQNHHHHLVCNKCAKVIDYTDFSDEEKSFLDKTEKRLSKKHNFKIQEHEVVFKGLCEKCK
ncbi:MAG TPA: transcriptional repressor [Elusimicrobiales bacterium]|nr:transcriptional repressor [Elusimicrobiales bacterium]